MSVGLNDNVTMKIVVFDTNAFDHLALDPYTCELIRVAISRGVFKALVTRTVAAELFNKPHFGIPTFFPLEYRRNAVPIVGIMAAGDALGDAKVFREHLGRSAKVNDALIADAAVESNCDWLVSDDQRLLHRLPAPHTSKGLPYSEFRTVLHAYCADNGISSRVFLMPKALLSQEQEGVITARTAEDAKAGEAGSCTCWHMTNWSSNLWAIVHTESQLPIGAFHFAGADNYVDVGWWIDKAYRRQGFGSEAIDRLALLLKARRVTKLTPIGVQGKHKEASSKLRARLEAYFAE